MTTRTHLFLTFNKHSTSIVTKLDFSQPLSVLFSDPDYIISLIQNKTNTFFQGYTHRNFFDDIPGQTLKDVETVKEVTGLPCFSNFESRHSSLSNLL